MERRAILRPVDEPEVLTIPEVAERLRVTTKTVYGLCQRGALPSFRVGRVLRCLKADLDQFIKQQRASERASVAAAGRERSQ
jgi:excisionase family DNA binding protein